MAEAYWSVTCAVDADSAWRTIRKFNALPDWHPDFRSSELVEGHSEFEVSAVRVLTLNDGGQFRERLVGLDDSSRTLVYEIISAPIPLANYRAQMRVLPINDTNTSLVIWQSTFDPTDDTPPADAAKSMAEGAYAPALAALQDYLK